MFIQYKRDRIIPSTQAADLNLKDMGLDANGLITCGIKITAGAPSTEAGLYNPTCFIPNQNDHKIYLNIGSTASPSWTTLDAGAGFTLPAAITDATTTVGTSLQLTMSTLTTGIGENIIASALTSGVIYKATAGPSVTTAGGTFQSVLGGSVAGFFFDGVGVGNYADLNGAFRLTLNSMAIGTMVRFNATGLTTGDIIYAVGGASMASGGNIANFDMGAGVAGSAILAQTSGIYVGTDGVSAVVASAATTGILHKVIAGAAALSTGRYYSANDGALEVFGIGANGHIFSNQTTPPSILITVAQGITAVGVAPGSTDTCGIITSTGTQNNTADSTFTLTFSKTYTTAPKGVVITAANASAALAAQSGIYVVSVSATAIVFGVPKSSAAGATPSWRYVIIA